MAIMKPWQATILKADGGEPDSGATVEVTDELGGGAVTLYDGRDTATANSVGNPFSADANGFVQFWMENGRYTITVTGSDGGVTTFSNWQHFYTDQGTAKADAPTFDSLTITTSATLPAGSTIGGVTIADQDWVTERITAIDDWQDSVLDEQSSPPGTPSDGDRYIVGASPTGDWSANENDIAQWDDTAGSWDFTTADKGMATLRESDDTFRVFNGTSWVSLGSVVNHNNLLSLQGGTSGEKYHLTSAQHTSVGNIVSAGHAEAMDQGVATTDSPQFTSITVDDTAKNAQGAKTVSTGSPSGGADGDVHYQTDT